MSNHLDILKRFQTDLGFFSSKCVSIVNKNRERIPFVFNEAQEYIHSKLEEQREACGFVRAIIVKGRQQGCSTYIALRYVWKALFNADSSVFIMAHKADSTDALFNMAKGIYTNIPEVMRLGLNKSNMSEMVLRNGSSYSVGTAGSAEVGRGTTISHFHGSEVAFWENSSRLAAGILQAVPMAPGSELIFESTSNGPGDFFHSQAMKALKNSGVDMRDMQLIFVPWFMQPEYTWSIPSGVEFHKTPEEQNLQATYERLTDEKLYWRRKKIDELVVGGDYDNAVLKFQREYPNSVSEAFLASGIRFFNIQLVEESMARKMFPVYGGAPKIMGVDPGRDGDSTSIWVRQGRNLYKYASYDSMNQMRMAGILAKAYDSGDADYIFVDVAHGYGTLDRLYEMGYPKNKIKGVPFNVGADQSDVYRNKRAEIHGDFRDWVADGAKYIQRDELLLGDMQAVPMEKVTSSGLIYLIEKDIIKKDLGRSPNDLDAVCLTFAYRVKPISQSSRVQAAPRVLRSGESSFRSVGGGNRNKTPYPKDWDKF